MVVKRSQAEIIIYKLIKVSINQQVQMSDPVVKYVPRQFEGNINTSDPQGPTLYLKATN